MKSKTSLTIISIISLIGVLFSGYLTFTEVGGMICPATLTGGTGMGCRLLGSQILGLPTCMYGLIMYLAIFVISLLGRK
jgi:hypothetical protein